MSVLLQIELHQSAVKPKTLCIQDIHAQTTETYRRNSKLKSV